MLCIAANAADSDSPPSHHQQPGHLLFACSADIPPANFKSAGQKPADTLLRPLPMIVMGETSSKIPKGGWAQSPGREQGLGRPRSKDLNVAHPAPRAAFS